MLLQPGLKGSVKMRFFYQLSPNSSGALSLPLCPPFSFWKPVTHSVCVCVCVCVCVRAHTHAACARALGELVGSGLRENTEAVPGLPNKAVISFVPTAGASLAD